MMSERYNVDLEDQIDHYFIADDQLKKNKQMGGVGWLINGNMCVGIYEELLIVRVDPAKVDSLIKKDGIHLFGHREDNPDNFLSLTKKLYERPEILQKFLSHALAFTSSLKTNPLHEPSADLKSDDSQ